MTPAETERERTLNELYARLNPRVERVRTDGGVRHVIDSSEVLRALVLMLPGKAERMAAE